MGKPMKSLSVKFSLKYKSNKKSLAYQIPPRRGRNSTIMCSSDGEGTLDAGWAEMSVNKPRWPWTSGDERATRLTYTPKKMHRVRIAQVPVYRFQDVTLCEENLRFSVQWIRAVKEVWNGGSDNLLDLGRNKETRNIDELQFCKGNDPCKQDSIDNAHAKKERLGQQSESGVLHRVYLRIWT